MNITTKKGDQGYTDLKGDRVLKCDNRVESYGCIDELNTQVGLLHFLSNDIQHKQQLENIMDLNRKICSDLATVENTRPYKITETDVKIIDEYINILKNKITKLSLFERPIGNQIFHQANIVRAITRKAERRIIKLAQEEDINREIIPLINRLSDYFFILAKLNNQ